MWCDALGSFHDGLGGDGDGVFPRVGGLIEVVDGAGIGGAAHERHESEGDEGVKECCPLFHRVLHGGGGIHVRWTKHKSRQGENIEEMWGYGFEFGGYR
jgi:hypothetical protein